MPFAPPRPIAPATSPLATFSSRMRVPPSIITAAASWRVRALRSAQDEPGSLGHLRAGQVGARDIMRLHGKVDDPGPGAGARSTSATKQRFFALGVHGRQHSDGRVRRVQWIPTRRLGRALGA